MSTQEADQRGTARRKARHLQAKLQEGNAWPDCERPKQKTGMLALAGDI
jgi:hypothetical protein